MKLHLLIFTVLIFTSCTFFSNKETNKDKAKQLFSEITAQQNQLDSQINSIVHATSNSDSEIFKLEASFLNWKTEFEKFKEKKVYMNYDLQLMQLEEMEINLEKIKNQLNE